MAGLTGKSLVRKEFLKRRLLLSSSEYERRNSLLKEHFLNWLTNNPSFTTFHSFLPIKKNKEVDTWPLIEQLNAQNKRIIISKTDFENSKMNHFLYHESLDFETDRFGIPSPKNAQKADFQSVEVVLIPLVAADRRGGRLGYGKGFYDRLLAEKKQAPIKLGLNLAPCCDRFPFLEPHDESLDYCITPFEIVKCYG